MTDRLMPGQSLAPGNSITSEDGRFQLILQNDGNLVLYSVGGTGGWVVLWAAGTNGPVWEAIMQADGDFVLYEPDERTAKWASATNQADSYLIVQNDGNLVIYNANNAPLWATATTIVAEGQVPGFLPSVNGFHFPNGGFPSGPSGTSYPVITLPVIGTISGDATNGLCGGFVFAALDLFNQTPQLAPPPDTSPPADGTPTFDYLTGRLIDSFGAPPTYDNAAKVIQWITLPTHDVAIELFEGPGLARRMVETEWPTIKADIDAGNPSPLNLVGNPGKSVGDIAGIIDNLHSCHQVLAFGYRLHGNGPLILQIYDCNDPGDDHSEVSFMPFSQATDHNTITISAPAVTAKSETNLTVRGVFRSVYSPKTPTIPGTTVIPPPGVASNVKMVKVPNLAGMTQTEAQAAATGAQLNLTLTKAGSPPSTWGKVTSQSPSAGTKVPMWSDVRGTLGVNPADQENR